MVDFFVSHASEDQAWAEWIAWQIESIGYSAVLQAWDFSPGSNFVAEMDEAAVTSMAVIAVVSPAYMKSVFAKSEWAAAFASDPVGTERRLIPVRVEVVPLRGLLSQIVYIDLVGVDGAVARDRLTDGIRGLRQKPVSAPPFPGVMGGTVASAPTGLQAAEVSSPTTEAFRSNATRAGIFEHLYTWILADQIPSSGGWGRSQEKTIEAFTQRPLSQFERSEGGVVSTFLALRALLHYEGDVVLFRGRDYSRAAGDYFRERQHSGSGGFGRRVASRSGVEVHASLRHTAFSLASLWDLGISTASLTHGIKYLNAHNSPEAWQGDACPPLAVVGLLYFVEAVTATTASPQRANIVEQLTSGDGALPSSEHLLEALRDLSINSTQRPFWEPYGGLRPMLFDTALTTIELIPTRLLGSLADLIAEILGTIARHVGERLLMFGPDAMNEDVGISCLYLSAFRRASPYIASYGNFGEIEAVYQKLTLEIPKVWHIERYWRYTYVDTVASTLLFA